MRFRFLTALLAVTCTSLSFAGQVDTVYIPASRDVTLYEDSLGLIANGSGQHLFAGRTDSSSGGSIRRALVHFDIAGYVPAGVFISEAHLTLNISETSADSQWVALHDVTSMWTEGPSDPPGDEAAGAPADTGDVTWLNCNFPFNTWTDPGGDFNGFVADTVLVAGTGPYTWNSMYVAASVKRWLDTPSINMGWVLIGNEGSNETTRRFDSREHPTPVNQPELMVVYASATWTRIPIYHDNTLYEDSTGSLSNGVGQHFFAGRTRQEINSIRRGVLVFNMSPYVPKFTNILDARMILHMSRSTSGPSPVVLHKLLETFLHEGSSDAADGEGQGAPAAGQDITWLRYNNACGGCFWTSPGAQGDYDTTVSASLLVDSVPDLYVWQSAGLVTDVQAWADAQYSGRPGWLIKGDESDTATSKRFDTKDHPDSAFHPVLEVVWSGGCLIDVSGDVNVTGTLTTADIIILVNRVFKQGPDLEPCNANGDVNCSGAVTSADIIYMVMVVFKGQAPPCDICSDSPMAATCVE